MTLTLNPRAYRTAWAFWGYDLGSHYGDSTNLGVGFRDMQVS